MLAARRQVASKTDRVASSGDTPLPRRRHAEYPRHTIQRPSVRRLRHSQAPHIVGCWDGINAGRPVAPGAHGYVIARRDGLVTLRLGRVQFRSCARLWHVDQATPSGRCRKGKPSYWGGFRVAGGHLGQRFHVRSTLRRFHSYVIQCLSGHRRGQSSRGRRLCQVRAPAWTAVGDLGR